MYHRLFSDKIKLGGVVQGEESQNTLLLLRAVKGKIMEDFGKIKNDLKNSLNEIGLKEYSTILADMAEPSVELTTILNSASKLKPGQSKLGGSPDVPKIFEWPRNDGNPLSFLGQINVIELKEFDINNYLPEIGLISFFYDTKEMPSGLNKSDANCFKVYYFENIVDLEQNDSIVQSEEYEELARYDEFIVFKTCQLSVSLKATLPLLNSKYFPEINLNEEEKFSYSELTSIGWNIHRMFGYPYDRTNDMEMLCELVNAGLNCEAPDILDDLAIEKYKEASKEWILLLQLDSDNNAKMMWGDAARLYFWIKKEDLLKRNFDNIWMILGAA